MRLRSLALAIGAPLTLGAVQAQDLPAGAAISAGEASIHRGSSHLTVRQNSDKLAVDWQSFSIGKGHGVTFDQPSSSAVALNRVLGPDASVIQGALNANGQVFLINPNGVLFSKTAQVNVGGLVASTLNLSNDDFLAGDYRFSGDSTNQVANHGSITASDGATVALLAAKVENQGSIDAPQGNVLLGAGNAITLDLGDPVKLEVTQGAIDALIENGGAIRADGGTVLLTARAAEDLAGTVINNTGVIEARSLAAGDDGSIVLLGEHGAVEVAGTLDASSDSDVGGKIVATGDRVAIAEGARIEAGGALGGGEIYVGGGWQGRDPRIETSDRTTIAAGASLDASATGKGNGGTVVVWSDRETRFAGSIRAAGSDGDGGRVEVSGKETLDFAGDVDTGGGTLLLDPADIVVQYVDGDASNTFSGAQIKTLLENNDVTLTADNTITWAWGSELDYDGIGTGRTLTMIAGSDITVNGRISDSVAGGDALSVTIKAGGRVTVGSMIHGGAGGNVDIDAGGQVQLEGGWIETGGAGNVDIQTDGGVQVNSGVVRVADGRLRVSAAGNVNPIWGGYFMATGTGDIELTSRTGGIYLGGSGSSTGHIEAQSGNVTLTADTIERRGTSSVAGRGTVLLQPYSATASIGIGNGATGTLALSAATLGGLANGFSSIIIGRSDGSGAIDIRSVAFRDDVVIRTPSGSGSIAVNGALSTTADAITLEAAGGVTQAEAGGVQAAGLLLLGSGTFDLTAGTNNVGTLAADVGGPLKFHDANALTIGSVNGSHGISGTGAIAVSSDSGNLTVDEAVATTDTSDSAIVLNAGRSMTAGTASGGDIILNATLSTGADGRATLYTGTIDGSTGVAAAAGGSGSGRYRYGSDEAAAAYTTALGSGTYVIYRERPTLTVSPGTASGQYGDTPDLSNVTYTVSGYRNGDTGGVSGTAAYTTAATATSSVGSYDIAYSGGLAHALGYALADDTGAGDEYSVTKRVLDLSGARAYDGTTNLASTIFTLGNLANGDTLNLTGIGTMGDKHAGDDKAVNLGTLALANGADGDLASNYTLAGGTHAVDISKAALTVSASDVTKTYDGSTSAAGTATVMAGMLFGTDSLSGGDFAFSDADAGAGKTVTVANVTVNDGNGSNNYDVTYIANTSSTITRKALTLNGSFAAGEKVYDGNTNAAIIDASNLTLAGLVGAETLGLSGLTAVFTDKDAGIGKTVNLATASLADGSGKASNYWLDLAAAPTAKADIVPKSLTLGGTFTASDKVYDGTTAATIDTTGLTLSGLVAGEDLSLAALAGSFSDKNAGLGITVSIDAASLEDGANGRASNYTLDMSEAPSTTADIVRRQVRVKTDDQSIRLGMPDPVLAYTVQAQSGNRGLVAGESLAGTPARAPGTAIGNYAIGRGTLTDANNPNYAIAFVDGVFHIAASPEVLAAQHVAQTAPQEQGVQADLNASQTLASGTLQFVEAASASEAAGGQEGGGDRGQGQPGAAVIGPLTVLVIEGGIRLPDVDGLQD